MFMEGSEDARMCPDGKTGVFGSMHTNTILSQPRFGHPLPTARGTWEKGWPEKNKTKERLVFGMLQKEMT